MRSILLELVYIHLDLITNATTVTVAKIMKSKSEALTPQGPHIEG